MKPLNNRWVYPQKAGQCCNVTGLSTTTEPLNHGNHTDSWAESKTKHHLCGCVDSWVEWNPAEENLFLAVGVRTGRWITSNRTCSLLQSIQIPEADIQNQRHHEQNDRGLSTRTQVTSPLISALRVSLFMFSWIHVREESRAAFNVNITNVHAATVQYKII